SPKVNPPPLPMVDFGREGVLLVAMGARPSAGYGLSLASGSATVRDAVLSVRVNWREPPPGYRQAQVVTSPCLALKVPDAPFSRITVLDQAGRVRLEGAR
ncbi:MAG: protease complex subunit PrcB family protein, partial [Candidatus Competibacter sp.]